MDKAKIEKAVRMILEAVGENPEREGLRETPRRVAKMFEEVLGGINKKPEDDLALFHAINHDEMIIVKDIPFYSFCEHHLLPFIGKAHIAYVPGKEKVTGLSKLIRVLETQAKRLQMQERLTADIADAIMRILKPQGVLVVIEAEHLCMSIRGVKKPGAIAVTSAMRGVLRKDATRAEAFALIKAK